MFVSHRVGFERNRRLHRSQGHELQQMVRDHVAQRAGLFIVSAALFDADLLAGGNLHAVDVAAIPDRLEDAVAESKYQNVLDGFFAQIVIDTIDLILVQDLLQCLVKLAGRIEIAAEGFFDHEPPPAVVLLSSQPDRSELFHDRSKIIRRSGQVEEVIALGISFSVDFAQIFFQSEICLVVIEIT